ncbi:MAG: hypothetical protein IJ716_08195 [Lachnospiraceae bacterium]|nr:hypothetical protein [Lachnospiraceae bacterium]
MKNMKKTVYQLHAAAVVEAEDSKNTEDEQIPGQDNIMNHPEYLPRDLSGTEEENHAEVNGDTGAAGNSNDVSDVTDRDGAIEQPGDAEGMDRESENVQESEKDAGTDNCENVPHSVITQCEGNLDMTDEEYISLWEDINISTMRIRQFMHSYTNQEMVQNHIMKSSLEEAYKEAINVAAGLEKMINGKKYSA